METFRCKLTLTPRGTVLSLTGDIGLLEIDDLTKQFMALIDAKPALVVLDLAAVTMVASAGMGAMTALLRDLGKQGGKVRLAAVTPLVRESLRRALVDRIFQIYDTVDAALAAA